MAKLFESSVINGLVLANRSVRSATHEGLATMDGKATPELRSLLVELAQGEVGLIISGHAAVSLEGQAGPKQLLVHDDSCSAGLASVAEAVHAVGGKIALQLAHAGMFARPMQPDVQPLGASHPSYDANFSYGVPDLAGLDLIVEKFAAAAKRAQKAGFDAVQIHAAHTYCLSQFLSPFFNKRTDKYGGSLENRARLLLRVVEAVRVAVGSKFPVLVKLNSEDFLEGGLSREESLKVCLMLEQASVDAIELSGGAIPASRQYETIRRATIRTTADEVFYREAASAYKQLLKIPLILVGGIRSLVVAESLLQDGMADYVAMSRPLVCDPDLIKGWREARMHKTRCLSDNACFIALRKGEGLCCMTFREKEEKSAR